MAGLPCLKDRSKGIEGSKTKQGRITRFNKRFLGTRDFCVFQPIHQAINIPVVESECTFQNDRLRSIFYRL